MKTILITGAAGFIGSHTAYKCLKRGYSVILLDRLIGHRNLETNLYHLRGLATDTPGEVLDTCIVNLTDRNAVIEVFDKHSIDGVIHCAGLKDIQESTLEPLSYINHNVTATMNLLAAMSLAGVKSIVFASSAGVYTDVGLRSDVNHTQYGEPTHLYGQTKKIVEQLLYHMVESKKLDGAASLRIANPIDLDLTSPFEEDITGHVRNLSPTLKRCHKTGQPFQLNVGYHGDVTSTASRDYILVQDVAKALVDALEFIVRKPANYVWNCSSGVAVDTRSAVDQLIKHFNLAVTVIEVQHPTHDQPWSVLSNEGFNEDFGWCPQGAFLHLGDNA